MQVTVLVIAPPFRSELLKNTLASIRRQDYRLDVLVVDDGDLTGETLAVSTMFGFACKHRTRKEGWSNPAIPFNMGIKAAQGDVIISMGSDTMFTRPTDVYRLIQPHFRGNLETMSFATCEKIGEADGQHFTVNATDQRELYFGFGAAFRKDFVVGLGGFEESYKGWGCDDEDFGLVLRKNGVKPIWFPPEEVLTHHQYHPWVPPDLMNTNEDHKRLAERRILIEAGHLSNEGREWGIGG